MEKIKIAGYFFILIICFSCALPGEEESAAYYTKYRVILSGIIQGKEYLEHDIGIAYLKVRNSNVRRLDTRDSSDSYLLVIKDSLAELVCSYNKLVQKNDSLYINYNEHIIKCYRNGIQMFSYDLPYVLPSKYYISELKKLHKL